MRAAAWMVILVAWAAPTAAHPAPFSFLDLRIVASGVEGALVVHDFDVAHEVGIGSPESLRDLAVAEQYRDVLTRLMEARIGITLDGAHHAVAWTGYETLPDRQSLRLTFWMGTAAPGRLHIAPALFPYDPTHQTFVNVYEGGDLRHQAILDQQRGGMDYYAGSWQGTAAVLGVFVPAGIEHIMIGPDHILFLVGLLLLGGSGWRLATIVTAFTIGHSITLSLAALDIVSPPAALVEPVIALSIVFVGADNLLVQREARAAARGGPATPRGSAGARDIRPWVAGVFGLVHGFGFASVLREFGLPGTALGWSLFSFNVGVEIGQLAIVLGVAAALAGVNRRNPLLGQRLILAGSVSVIAAGGYWFIERVFLAGGSS
jgi:hydrogenase/urease accessory protein HupE